MDRPTFVASVVRATLSAAFIALPAFLALPAALPGQQTLHGDWYHVGRTDSVANRDASYAATMARNGPGAMTVLCGLIDLPVLGFAHSPLDGTSNESRLRLLLEGDSVTTWHPGELLEDRQTTRVSYTVLDLIRVRVKEDDRLHVRVSARDGQDSSQLVFSARGLNEAVERLPCVQPVRVATPDSAAEAVRPKLLNNHEVATALERFYPPGLRDLGIGGTVNVWFFIDRAGRVQEAVVGDPSPYGSFNRAALRVARIMRFTPAYNGGEPVPVWVALDVTFEVQ